ncbi:hypothetical protein TNCV_3422391 [Trichonephila clavipes]|nr:hypothetical protein TNCV_3422391 [Trichonephila clavipes]
MLPNGTLTSTTHSSSFTNVTEMESFNDSHDFSIYSFKSDRDMDLIPSNLMFLSDFEDVQSIWPLKGLILFRRMNTLDILLKCVKWKGHIDKSESLGSMRDICFSSIHPPTMEPNKWIQPTSHLTSVRHGTYLRGGTEVQFYKFDM